MERLILNTNLGAGKVSRLITKMTRNLKRYNDGIRSWGSSASIVSDNRLDDRGSIPGRGKGFFF
jgi:hypothetical protein